MAIGSTRLWRWAVCGLVAAVFSPGLLQAQNDTPAELTGLSEDEARQVQIAERFLSVLEKNPRRGTALDRVYGHHVEFGTLDDFLAKLKQRVTDNAQDGTGWMLLGLFAAHRGEDADAVDAFRKAEEFRPGDALAPYYLGQSLLLIGRPDEAVQAFERAVDRKPQRADLLEIFQQLGRVHQRAQRTEDALKVWERLEAMFPDDPRVQEQIAVTLVDEGGYAQALPRYEKLVQLVNDDYRRTMFRVQAAELKIRLGRREEGLADLEKLLADLNPQSWLHRDVRRRIEDVFLRSGDQDGLVKYYEKWAAGHAEDVDAMARLARFLASSARVPEATEWMEKALKLAPSRTELRKAFIDQLVDEQRYPEAAKQYALLVASAPGDPDFLRDWGKLVLRDKERPPEERRQEAARIWDQIVAARPEDALTTAQVADLFRQANMNDQAIALYQKAVELAPNDPQYREYLGEFYHILKRPDDARQTWAAIAEGTRHTAVNVARLAEVYNSFGYLDDAVEQIAEACRLDPKDFSLQLKGAEYHNRAEKFDEALRFVAAAESLAANDEERDEVVKQRIEVLQSSRRLEEETEQLAASLQARADAAAGEWVTLARYYEADREWTRAAETIEKALSKDRKSVPALATAARIAELSGDYARASELNGQLADADRRSRGDYLMNVARLEAQLGRAEKALQAGRDLIISAPGNTDNYEFYAQLCFQLGKRNEGLDTLRKAVRINPTEPHLIMALGSALSQQFLTDEAIEVYWRAFEKSEEIDDKTSLTMKLAELYLQINQFDKLTERFERDRREDDKRREMTICLAQAHHSAGDYGTARMELEGLLSQQTRDTNLLQQLSKLCEEGSDFDAAIEYQRQLVAIAPGHETEYRLAGLLQRRGEVDEASEIFVKLTRREEDPSRLLRSLDSLLSQGSYESVLAVTEPLLSEQRDDWELLYREGVAWASLEKFDEAADRFQRLLALNVPHDAMGASAAERFKQEQAKARSNNLQGTQTPLPQRPSPLTTLNNSSQVRRAVGLDPDRSYYPSGSGPQPVWTPEAFGVARMAAYGWLMRIAQQEQSGEGQETAASAGASEERFDELARRAAAAEADRETIYDWLYVEQLRGNFDSVFQMAKRLAQGGGREEQQFYLNSLRLRGTNSQSQLASRSGNEQPKRGPLEDDELELMLRCYRELSQAEDSQLSPGAAYGNQIVFSSSGQAYINVGGRYVALSSYGGTGGVYLGQVIEELKLAGRDQQAEELLEEKLAQATSAQELSAAMQLLSAQEKYERVPEFYARWSEAAKEEAAKQPAGGAASPRMSLGRSGGAPLLAQNAYFLMQWMGRLGPEEEHAQVLSILDPALDLAIEEAKQRRAQQHRNVRRSSQSQRASTTQFNVIYGKDNSYVRIDYPRPNEYVDNSALMLLREVYEVFKRNDVLDDLPNHLRKRFAESQPEDRLYDELMLGYVLWWCDEQEEAMERLSRAAEALPDDPSFRLEIASLYEQRGDFDAAMEIVESITPRDQDLVRERETMALQLAERLGDIERARQAAERLFGLRLDTNTQLALVERMRRLGMHEMAEAVVSRVHRRSGNQTSSLASLMTMYQAQGKTDLAQQVAYSILRRTASPLTASSTSRRNPFRTGRRSDDALRTQALQLLHQTGALQGMVERLEAQLERSPGSPRLYEELVELYGVTNERDKVQGLLEKAVQQRPDAAVLRYQLAKQLESTGKLDEACDQYLEIIRQKPEWIAEDLYQVRRVFERGKRALDLVQAIEKINLKSIGQPYYVIDLVATLLRDEKNVDVAMRLFERVFEAFPSYRNQLMTRLYDQKIWKHEKVFELGKKAVLPTESEVAAQPWFGVNSIYSYSSNGRVNSSYSQMLNGIQGTDKLPELRKAIEEKVDELPGWYGGGAMLALIDLKNGQKGAAKERLEALVADEEVVKAMPSDACWIVGQELDQFADTRPLAIRLFEQAVQGPNRMSQIQYSPINRLLSVYADSGRREQARELLLQHLRSGSANQYDAQYGSYLRVENSAWAAGKFLDLGFPVDAVRLYQELVRDPQTIEAAGSWYGSRPEYFANQVRTGMNRALAALDGANADDAITQLLAAPKEVRPETPVLDLMLTVPDAKTLREKPMESPLINLLHSISKDEKVGTMIDERLAELNQSYPQDFSVGTAWTVYRLKQKDPRATEALAALADAVSESPLEEIPLGRRPNSRQRRQALLSVPLWLAARECLAESSRRELGDMLARRALAGARRQVGDEHAMAILYDWGNLALRAGDRPQAEAKWSELLELATQRPQRRPRPADQRSGAVKPGVRTEVSRQGRAEGATEGGSDGGKARKGASTDHVPPAPPLTISQFRLTVEVAQLAAENGMPALSRKAVRASLSGGLPVPDVTPTTPGSLRMSGSYASGPYGTVMSPTSPPGNQNAIEAEVATSLQKVLGKWSGADYPPGEVYALLVPLVFPASRPTDIMLYADSSGLREARVTNLGAALVDWAVRANQLEDLNQRIEARKADPRAVVPALVLQTHVALTAGEMSAAQRRLEELAANLETGTALPMLQLACHAALPASERKQLRGPAFAILKLAVRQLPEDVNSNNSSMVSLGALAAKVNRYLATTGDPASVKEYYENYLAGRQSYYSRYSGDYGQYLQWRDWAGIANEAAKAGVTSVAMDFAGRVTDFSYERYPRPELQAALAVICRDLNARTALQRYEAWRNWTLPSEGRKTVRLQLEWVPPVRAPQRFLGPGEHHGRLHSGDMLCNLTELIAAAQEAGRMDELREQARLAHEQKLENADFLWALLLIARGDHERGDALIGELVKTLPERNKRVNNQPPPTMWGDYLVYRACMQSPEFVDVYGQGKTKLEAVLRSHQLGPILAHVGVDYALAQAAKSKAAVRPGDDPGLVHWFAASNKAEAPDGVKPWWVVQEGKIGHLTGPGNDVLYYAYPVTGDFTFAFDGYFAFWAESHAGYGGVIVQGAKSSSSTRIDAIASFDSVTRPQALERPRGEFNRVEIQVAEGKLRYFLNRHLLYEEEAAPGSPWLTLFCNRTAITVFRNLEITGDPQVPREVVLFGDGRMDGWNTSFFSESQPRKRVIAEKPDNENSRIAYEQRNEPANYDWSVQNDVLVGAARREAAADAQSWAYYHRPLRDGESFRYEFEYVPGQSVAHPTIGRIALLLDPSGVQAHWIGRSGWDDDVLGVPLDNRLSEPECRRGPEQLPLRANDWNSVHLALRGDVAVLSLNGTVIYERPLEEEVDRRFGIFRYQRQSSRIRTAVLTGPWPEQFSEELRDGLLSMNSSLKPADRRLINRMLGEELFAGDASRIVERARALPEERAYDVLKNWVLPSPDHGAFRLYYQKRPSRDGFQSDGRPPAGLELLCPAIELVGVATRCGRLDELSDIIAQAKPVNQGGERKQIALAALVAMERGNDEEALAAIAKLYKIVDQGLPDNVPPRDRSPEFIVAWAAARHPALRVAADELAALLRDNDRRQATTPEWRTDVETLCGYTQALLGEAPVAGLSARGLTQWQVVPYEKPVQRWSGEIPSGWLYHRGMLQHLAGGVATQLYFQSPLRGKFEVRAERSMHGYQEAEIAYGMRAAEPRYDFKAVRVYDLMGPSKDVDGDYSRFRRNWVSEFRIVVDGPKVTTFVDGEQLYEEVVAGPPDPWVVLQARGPGYQSSFRNVRITGTPEVPEEIDLINTAGWGGWRADTYEEIVSADGSNANAHWKRAGEEIQGELRKDRAASPLESLLMYQRPMLEDGEVEFETFYVPGEFEVHPAVGRTALLIRPDGVRLHHLTDAQYETSGLLPGNEEALAGAASSVPLKEHEFNRVLLKMKGDRVTIAVNGTEVAHYELREPESQRSFGLFRYADQTKCRVRNVLYRGEWPKQLPPVEEQQLAYPAEGLRQIAADKLTDAIDVKLDQRLAELKERGFGVRAQDHFETTRDGTRMTLRNAGGYSDWPALFHQRRIEGDCAITVALDGLHLEPSREGWGAGVALQMELDAPRKTWCEVGLFVNREGTRQLKAGLHRVSPAGKDRFDGRVYVGDYAGGQLRLVREGTLIHCLYAKKGTEQFELLDSFAVGRGAVVNVCLQTKSSDSAGVVDVVAKRFTLATRTASAAVSGDSVNRP